LYIVKNNKNPISYTYWIIHEIEPGYIMYYHGVRTERKCGADIRDLEVYHGSSNIVNALYKTNPTKFKKRIERIFPNRELAASHEERVHHKCDVARNQRFYNLRNGCADRVKPKGIVAAKIDGKFIGLKSEIFYKLKELGVVTGSMAGTITCIDLTTNTQCRIPSKDFYKYPERYVGASKGQLAYYNKETGVTMGLYKNTNPTYPWIPYTKEFIQYRKKDIFDLPPVMLQKDDPKVISGEYVLYCADMITVYDKENNKHFNLHKSDSRIGSDYQTSASSKIIKDMCRVYDENFNISIMRNKDIDDTNYINSLYFKLKLISGGSVSLINYDPSKHNVAIREIKVLDLKTRLILNMLNVDKRLLKFKEYRKYDSSKHGDINYLYITKSKELLQSPTLIFDLCLYAKRIEKELWFHIPSNKIIKQIQNVIKKYQYENHIS